MALLVSDPRTESFNKPPPPKKKWIQNYLKKASNDEPVDRPVAGVVIVRNVIDKFQDYIEESNHRSSLVRPSPGEEEVQSRRITRLLHPARNGDKFNQSLKHLADQQWTGGQGAPRLQPLCLSKQQIGGVVQGVIQQFLNGSLDSGKRRCHRHENCPGRSEHRRKKLRTAGLEPPVKPLQTYRESEFMLSHQNLEDGEVLNLSLPKVSACGELGEPSAYTTASHGISLQGFGSKLPEDRYSSETQSFASIIPSYSAAKDAKCSAVDSISYSALDSPTYSAAKDTTYSAAKDTTYSGAKDTTYSTAKATSPSLKVGVSSSSPLDPGISTKISLSSAKPPPTQYKLSHKKVNKGGIKETSKTLASPNRELHNRLEKLRRAQLKQCFEELAAECQMEPRKTSNLAVIRSAYKCIITLRRKEREHEKELTQLVLEKIKRKQKLEDLKREVPNMVNFNSEH